MFNIDHEKRSFRQRFNWLPHYTVYSCKLLALRQHSPGDLVRRMLPEQGARISGGAKMSSLPKKNIRREARKSPVWMFQSRVTTRNVRSKADTVNVARVTKAGVNIRE